MDSGIECTFSKFSYDIKLRGAVNIQRDLDRIEWWAHVNTVKFNKAKGKVLHMGQGNPKHKYRMGREQIESRPEDMDLGVLVDEKPTMIR